MMWLLAAVSAVAVLASYHFLYLDALGGYHDIWPVYVFAGACLWSIAFFAAFVMRLVSPS
jgi:hypothetical protein